MLVGVLAGVSAEALKGSVHFARISVDGVSRTYEEQRGKPFASLLKAMDLIATLSPFGINVVVNERTIMELDAIAELAQEFGASELLLLPQQKTGKASGIDGATDLKLRDWLSKYKGTVRLAVSEAGASGLPICNPLPDERGTQAYAHIDASGTLRASSYATAGMKIKAAGVISALGQYGLSSLAAGATTSRKPQRCWPGSSPSTSWPTKAMTAENWLR